MLEPGLLEVRRNSMVALLGLNLLWSRSRFIFLVVVLTFACEIIWSFVFMGRAELESGERLAAIRHHKKESTHILITPKGFVHIA